MKHNYISDDKELVEKEKKHLNTTFYTAHVLHTYVKTPYSDSLKIFRLPAHLVNITTLLQGDQNISNNMNSVK